MSTNNTIESKSKFYTTSELGVKADASNSLTSEKHYVERTPIDKPRGLDEITDADGNPKKITIGDAPASMNPYFNLRVKTSNNNNYPLSDEDSASRMQELYKTISAKDLINDPRGASIYSVDDFLYTKNYGKIPLNRMITLRRFGHPVFDDIFNNKSTTEPDISRLIGFSDQDTNKLSDILTFTCGLRWKSINSTSEQSSMIGDQSGVDGMVGKTLRLVDPKFGQEAIAGRNKMNYDPQHDSNRVYGPVDSIASATIRDVGLNFDQNIELMFNFEMKSINGVNQKAAFIDLISNLILMSTNDGEFWGGARYWVGPQPSKYMNDLKSLDPKNFNDFVEKSTVEMKSFLGTMTSQVSAKETLKKIANNAMNLALGKMLNVLGRPGIPIMNSILTGNPIGPWHLTIGNPLNPILVAGDLIMENSEISFGNTLGYDDFPTEVNLKVTLKHSKARDRAGIESMFNAGKGRTYLKPEDIFGRSAKTVGEREIIRPLSDVLAGKNQQTKFGEFDESAVMRNKSAVWKFLDKDKKS